MIYKRSNNHLQQKIQIAQVRRKVNARGDNHQKHISPTFLKNSARDDDATNSVGTTTIPSCYYRSGDNRWQQRTQLKELKVGQKIVGEKISNTDLLDGKTGPKSRFLSWVYELIVSF